MNDSELALDNKDITKKMARNPNHKDGNRLLK
jgi:hypothetical protein